MRQLTQKAVDKPKCYLAIKHQALIPLINPGNKFIHLLTAILFVCLLAGGGCGPALPARLGPCEQFYGRRECRPAAPRDTKLDKWSLCGSVAADLFWARCAWAGGLAGGGAGRGRAGLGQKTRQTGRKTGFCDRVKIWNGVKGGGAVGYVCRIQGG